MSALGSLIKGTFDIASNALSNVYARKAAKTEYDRNIALWNMENEYNTPVNQMARLREAGLNPNLVAGNLSSSAAGSVGRAPQVHLRSPLEGLDLVGAYQDLRQRDAMVEQTLAQTQQIRAQERIAEITGKLLGLELKEHQKSGTSRGTSPTRKAVKQGIQDIKDASDAVASHVTKVAPNWTWKAYDFADKYIHGYTYGNN